MATITLFHGSPYESVTPEYGLGNDKHDYGRGFYLTANVELAKEWAVCRPDESNGWVHQYELDTNGLRILDFQEHSVLTWLAELMKHRDAADSKRYRLLAPKIIAKYGIDTVLWVKAHEPLRHFLVDKRGWREQYAGTYESIYVKPRS